MAFAMRMVFTDVIVDDSLKNCLTNGKKTGYQFDIRLAYYRGQFLSVIDEFGVTVDGEPVDPEHVKFRVNGREFSPVEFDKCYTEFWRVTDPATIRVFRPGGLAAGEHDVEVKLMFRSPYMPIGPDHSYMPVDGCGRKTLTLAE